MKKILYNHKWHFEKQGCRKFRRKQEKGKWARWRLYASYWGYWPGTFCGRGSWYYIPYITGDRPRPWWGPGQGWRIRTICTEWAYEDRNLHEVCQGTCRERGGILLLLRQRASLILKDWGSRGQGDHDLWQALSVLIKGGGRGEPCGRQAIRYPSEYSERGNHNIPWWVIRRYYRGERRAWWYDFNQVWRISDL